MVDQILQASSAFTGSPFASDLVRASFREDLTLASITAARSEKQALREAIKAKYGVDLPDKPVRVAGEGITFLWSGPDQWLAIAERANGRDLEREFRSILGGLAAVVDHSDGRAVCRISGPKAPDVLAKGVPIDLHQRAFPAGSVALTHASHVGIMIWKVDEAPTFDIAMFRSFADSFMHWLAASAEEFVWSKSGEEAA